MSSPVYLDYNATTPLLDEVRDLLARALADGWGNPSSHHWAGRSAKRLLDEGHHRHHVLHLLGTALAEMMTRISRDDRVFDPVEYAGLLEDLPGTWRPRP